MGVLLKVMLARFCSFLKSFNCGL